MARRVTKEKARRSQAEEPKKIPKPGWRELLTRTKDNISNDHVSMAAAGVAFYGIVAFFAALVTTVSTWALVFAPHQTAQQIELISGLLPQQVATSIKSQMENLASASGDWIIFAAVGSLLLTLYSASKGTKALTEGLNMVYEEDEKRSSFQLNFVALVLTLGLIVVMGVAFGLITIPPTLLDGIGFGSMAKALEVWLRWPILFVVMVVTLAIVYRYAPSHDQPRWQWVSGGTVIATLLWIAGSVAFSIYARNFASYNEIYGLLGAALIFLAWLWLSAFTVFLGAELNSEMQRRSVRRTARGRRQPAGPAEAARSEEAEQVDAAELFEELETGIEGLSSEEAHQRQERFGPNALEETEASALRKVLGYFWGPIPWMIEVAAALSALVRHWPDLIIISVLLVFNAAVGFIQEHQASNAVAALKSKLALQARALRDKRWQKIAARELVPGDMVYLHIGDIIPADVKLVQGDYLSVDQSALTGESLPVDKATEDVAYSGSMVKQGEMVALVTATGGRTYFGRTAQLVARAAPESHFQRAVLTIGDYLIYLSLALVALIIGVQLVRGAPLLELAQFALILVVASIPVALPAVLSVTMALGALALSRLQAIVARLESIEEMAGIDILCADKTGTLTKNELTLGDPVVISAEDAQELILAAALACPVEGRDAIDQAVLAGLEDPEILERYRQRHFVPFDPVHKRTEGEIGGPDGTIFKVTKGAPQVILKMSSIEETAAERVRKAVEELAGRGQRTLGVARSADGQSWQFLGLLSLYDPPREDARETLRQASEHGIQVKMVTGDNQAIAKEIAKELGLGTRICSAGEILSGEQTGPGRDAAQQAESLDGFAEVFPEHKYAIVKALQARGHLTGMTGDGVNDAPALKQADVGIAVAGATDAARAAADLVLTAPGLSVLVNAVEEARRIFERMNSYTIYRVTETIRIVVFIAFAMLAYDFYPITAVMVILLALLNDIPIMTIAFDNTWLDPKPVRWQMHRILSLASVLGLVGVVETFLLLVIAETWFDIPKEQLQSLVFLKLIVAGHLTLLVARTRRPFFTHPFPAPVLLAAVFATQALAVLIVGFGWFVTPIPWLYIGAVWVYALVWLFIEDWAKLRVYAHLGRGTPRHRGFLDLAQSGLHPHSTPRDERRL